MSAATWRSGPRLTLRDRCAEWVTLSRRAALPRLVTDVLVEILSRLDVGDRVSAAHVCGDWACASAYGHVFIGAAHTRDSTSLHALRRHLNSLAAAHSVCRDRRTRLFLQHVGLCSAKDVAWFVVQFGALLKRWTPIVRELVVYLSPPVWGLLLDLLDLDSSQLRTLCIRGWDAAERLRAPPLALSLPEVRSVVLCTAVCPSAVFPRAAIVELRGDAVDAAGLVALHSRFPNTHDLSILPDREIDVPTFTLPRTVRRLCVDGVSLPAITRAVDLRGVEQVVVRCNEFLAGVEALDHYTPLLAGRQVVRVDILLERVMRPVSMWWVPRTRAVPCNRLSVRFIDDRKRERLYSLYVFGAPCWSTPLRGVKSLSVGVLDGPCTPPAKRLVDTSDLNEVEFIVPHDTYSFFRYSHDSMNCPALRVLKLTFVRQSAFPCTVLVRNVLVFLERLFPQGREKPLELVVQGAYLVGDAGALSGRISRTTVDTVTVPRPTWAHQTVWYGPDGPKMYFDN